MVTAKAEDIATQAEETQNKSAVELTLTVLTKAETAQKSRSDVEFEPAMATAKVEDIATQAEETQNKSAVEL